MQCCMFANVTSVKVRVEYIQWRPIEFNHQTGSGVLLTELPTGGEHAAYHVNVVSEIVLHLQSIS